MPPLLICLRGGSWQLHCLSITLPVDIENLVLDYPMFCNTNREDKMVWDLANNGKFIMASAYNMLVEQPDTIEPSNKDFTRIWKVKVPNRIKIFL